MKAYIQKIGDKPLLNRVPQKRVPKAFMGIEREKSLRNLWDEMKR